MGFVNQEITRGHLKKIFADFLKQTKKDELYWGFCECKHGLIILEIRGTNKRVKKEAPRPYTQNNTRNSSAIP